MKEKMKLAFSATLGDIDETITVCDRNFPKFCDYCEYRFLCYTHAKKFMTLFEFKIYNEIRK